MKRKVELVNDEIYHIFSKSIAGYVLFNQKYDYQRMIDLMQYYQADNDNFNFSRVIDRVKSGKEKLKDFLVRFKNEQIYVQVISYCIMPTHIHFVLKQVVDRGISKFMMRVLNSYSHYFNAKYKRRGHLWEGRFKNVLVETDEQLQHLTRYVHLNPVTAKIIDIPEDWKWSSYEDYIMERSSFCDYKELIDMRGSEYKQFTHDNIANQRDLHIIKHLFLD